MAQLQGINGGGGKTRAAAYAPMPKVKPTYGISGITAVPKAAPRASGGTNYSSNGGGGGGGGYSGGGGGLGSSSGGQISGVSAPQPPSLSDFLGSDSVYSQQMSALQKAKADYLAQQGQQKTQYLTNYTGDLNTLKENRTGALGDLENDFASRGLIRSGLYADNMSDLTKQYDTKQSGLEQAKAAFLAQLASGMTNFNSQQDLTSTKAKQDAAARRAGQYGV